MTALSWFRWSLTRDLLSLAVWAALIFFLSSIPRLESGLEQDYLLRKIAHVTEFAVFTILAFRVLRHASAHRLDAPLGGALLAFIYALSDEVHQHFVPGRSGMLSDVGIDGVGIALALFFVILRAKRAGAAAVR